MSVVSRDKGPKGHQGPKGQIKTFYRPLCLWCPLGPLSLLVLVAGRL